MTAWPALLLAALASAASPAPAKTRACVQKLKDGTWHEPATFEALKGCQERQRQAVIDRAYARTGRLPPEEQLEALEDRQRAETRAFVARHAREDHHAEEPQSATISPPPERAGPRSDRPRLEDADGAPPGDDGPVEHGGTAILPDLRDDAVIAEVPKPPAAPTHGAGHAVAAPALLVPTGSVPGVAAPEVTRGSR